MTKSKVTEKDLSHVIAGYKATISRADTSDEAKQHAREQLEKLESTKHDKEEEHRMHVIAGLKAALHNDNVHEDTKEHLRVRLAEMGVKLDVE